MLSDMAHEPIMSSWVAFRHPVFGSGSITSSLAARAFFGWAMGFTILRSMLCHNPWFKDYNNLKITCICTHGGQWLGIVCQSPGEKKRDYPLFPVNSDGYVAKGAVSCHRLQEASDGKTTLFFCTSEIVQRTSAILYLLSPGGVSWLAGFSCRSGRLAKSSCSARPIARDSTTILPSLK